MMCIYIYMCVCWLFVLYVLCIECIVKQQETTKKSMDRQDGCYVQWDKTTIAGDSLTPMKNQVQAPQKTSREFDQKAIVHRLWLVMTTCIFFLFWPLENRFTAQCLVDFELGK